jgi:hypothetical protein
MKPPTEMERIKEILRKEAERKKPLIVDVL